MQSDASLAFSNRKTQSTTVYMFPASINDVIFSGRPTLAVMKKKE